MYGGRRMIYAIANEKLQVKVNSYGAEIVSVQYEGKERFWQNETGEWAGHSPVLFPLCGHFGITVDGKTYPMKAHGFARKCEFACTKQTETELAFTISASEETKKYYPYDFVLTVIYTVEGNKLFASYKVQNPAEKSLYFACGGHDAFATQSGDMSNYQITFDKEEHFLHYYHDDDGYLTGDTRDFGKGKTLVLPQDFLQGGATLIFKDMQNSKVTLCETNGKKLASLTFEGFDNLLLWREDNGAFICIEPWTNLPDLVGAADVELCQKAGVIEVQGGQEKTVTRIMEWF